MSIAPSIFISYSHADVEWLQEFKTHLKPYIRSNADLKVWDDNQIAIGARWKAEIEKALESATIAVLLVSPNFLYSDFIAKKELPPLLKAAEEKGLTIFWIPIRDSAYEETEIKDYQAAYPPNQPIAKMQPADRDTAWKNVCQKLKKTWEKDPILTKPLSPSPTPSAVPTFAFDVVTVNAQGQEIDRQENQAEYRRENLGQGVFLDMVDIPANEFLMGTLKKEAESHDDERPQHWVTVPRFFMGKYPVTQAQWQMVAALPRVTRSLNAEPLSPEAAEFEGDNRPVIQVSWYDAVEFCQRLTHRTRRKYRLPSEAEWEYACRAGTSTPFHFGETMTPDLVNYNGNYPYGAAPEGQYRQRTTPVGSFPPNQFGLYDMHGNVWEWCADHWHGNYEDAPIDGSAWLTDNEEASRLLRGGSWDDLAGLCRSASRIRGSPDYRDFGIGFRVVCSSAWTL